MNLIDQLFHRLKAQNRRAFVPFVTAGDPNLHVTADIVRGLVKHGANLIEIGFPYSDPIADGAVIQASYTRALANRLRMDDIFALAKSLSADRLLVERGVPLVSMVSYSLVYHRGPGRFLAQARESGFSGAIVPDLPIDEADELAKQAADLDFKLIQLVTPTTPRDRIVRIAQLSSGFLYVVSVTGITGERDNLPEEILAQLRWLRGQTQLPICVGFGISKPEHVRMLRDWVDGIIVGSAIVRRLEAANVNVSDGKSTTDAVDDIGQLARDLVAALNPT
jgi:tryptophan synthase alpha chain